LIALTSEIYDNNICDPYFCLQKGIYRERAGIAPDHKVYYPDLPWVVALVKHPSLGYPEEAWAKDNFLLKTLHLMAQDYKGIFNVAFVRVNPDEHLLAATFSIDSYS